MRRVIPTSSRTSARPRTSRTGSATKARRREDGRRAAPDALTGARRSGARARKRTVADRAACAPPCATTTSRRRSLPTSGSTTRARSPGGRRLRDRARQRVAVETAGTRSSATKVDLTGPRPDVDDISPKNRKPRSSRRTLELVGRDMHWPLTLLPPDLSLCQGRVVCLFTPAIPGVGAARLLRRPLHLRQQPTCARGSAGRRTAHVPARSGTPSRRCSSRGSRKRPYDAERCSEDSSSGRARGSSSIGRSWNAGCARGTSCTACRNGALLSSASRHGSCLFRKAHGARVGGDARVPAHGRRAALAAGVETETTSPPEPHSPLPSSAARAARRVDALPWSREAGASLPSRTRDPSANNASRTPLFPVLGCTSADQADDRRSSRCRRAGVRHRSSLCRRNLSADSTGGRECRTSSTTSLLAPRRARRRARPRHAARSAAGRRSRSPPSRAR